MTYNNYTKQTNEETMSNPKEIKKFKSGQIYSSQSGRIYLCESVTEDEVTFRISKVRRTKTGEIRFAKHTNTFKIEGKREPQQKAAIYKWVVCGQQKKEFIFAE